ncbi:MAG: glycosyltransferase [Bacteroidetes bacterium]|nr:glycosyltransferase [Bacteroidota bacterium]MBL0064035.1 glycosyltransferase [Bacteroidota bacterium]MBL0139579.1 glycosyltransferase [Bacteroidota bacterium]
MKILQICHRVPYPPLDGGNIAMLNMAKSLVAAGAEVHQFALNTKKHYVKPESFPANLKELLHFQCADLDTRITIGGAFSNLFKKESYNVVRFFNEEIEKTLASILQKEDFDVVQFETLFATPYIPVVRKYSRAKVSLRAHNAEHIIWERLAGAEKNVLKRTYLKFLSRRLKKYELEILDKIDFLIPITKVDEQIFKELGYRRPVLSLPLGVNLEDYPINRKTRAPLSLFHLGSMDWLPNIEGVEWFLEKCWPEIHSAFPDLKLFLAGRNFPEYILEANLPGVFCEGRIENANAYMSDKQIMIVPLLSGSGMRVKIIQGMALGKTIISTTIGAEGINAESGKNILIADTPLDYFETIKKCLDNPEACRQIGIAARQLAEEEYSNLSIGKKLLNFYREKIN